MCMRICKIAAQMEYMETVLQMVEDVLTTFGTDDVDDRTKLHILTSVEEIFTNISSYAYGPDGGEVEVICGVDSGTSEQKESRLWIRFKDWGVPYNPLKVPEPDFRILFEERRIGGLGIYMVKKMMDEMEYRYEDSCNILTIGKWLRRQS